MLARANQEFVDIISWYMNQQDGLDEKFVDQFDIETAVILNQPLIFPKSKKGYHQALMKIFPFQIIYSVDQQAGIITIVSIFHTSRHPRKKTSK
ncbi:type II toxin-antitoxin system RelE/ParE family toxin [Mucilaginibacter sp.]|uniref:type II toxin-antitoxin system RelE/ParE family toxin n=1 Tax=Mucilaginibacter sp. TaxID=1882438 RepID=UPI003B009CBA